MEKFFEIKMKEKNLLKKDYNTDDLIKIYINLDKFIRSLYLSITYNQVSIKEALEISKEILNNIKKYILTV